MDTISHIASKVATVLATIAFSIGSALEPNPALWFWAAGASFLGVSLGKDRTLTVMVTQWLIGTVAALAAGGMLAHLYAWPRAPVVIGFGFFGYTLVDWLHQGIRERTILGVFAAAMRAWRGKGS